MLRFNALDWLSLILVVVGGLNWGLIAVFDFNLIATLFGPLTLTTRVIYLAVGLAALYTIVASMKVTRAERLQSPQYT
jgi:uncharacterized protein